MVEVCLSLPIFLSTILVAIELLRVSFSILAVQYAVNRTVRYASVASVGSGVSREDKIREKLIALSPISVAPTEIYMCPSVLDTCGISNAGGPGEWVWIRVTRRMPVALGLGTITIVAVSLWKNEYWIQA